MFLKFGIEKIMGKHSLNRYIRFFSLSLPVSCSLLLSSCKTDFTSVETFVDNNHDAIKNSSDIVAQDFYDSCLRSANYTDLTTSNGIETRNDYIKTCNSVNKPFVETFQMANDVILEYMSALGSVASGKTVTLNTSINDLQTALINQNSSILKLPAPTVKAGTDILQILANVFSKSARGQALKKAILCSDDSFHKYITGNPASAKEEQLPNGGLIQIAQDGYINDGSGILGIEKTRINSYFTTYFVELGKLNESEISTQISTKLEVQKDYTNGLDIVQKKSDNAQSYIKILKATAKAHHDLKTDFLGQGKNAINPQEVNELCRSVLAGKISKLEKSNNSKKLDIDQQQLYKAKTIVTEYFSNVKH